ncbi:MmyB family transcriptional regulator [Streptomyces mirabilis]|uniref:MmyB family transcriptional regulator n=1 Tax=Streptomyces mirabilis TaxID=68239 RepID=UPI0036C83221
MQAARAAEADSARDQLHPDLLRLLDAFPTAAAYLMGPTFGILATNAIADALLSPFEGETSMPRILFTHPRARSVFRDWKLVTSATVYALHLNAAGSATPPRSATWPRNCWRCQMSSGPCGTTRPSGSPHPRLQSATPRTGPAARTWSRSTPRPWGRPAGRRWTRW